MSKQKDGFLEYPENKAFERLILLLRNGYTVPTRKHQLVSHDALWLKHTFRVELDLILYSDGMLVDTSAVLLGDKQQKQLIRILKENDNGFSDFLKGLPKVNTMHKLLSTIYRGGR